MTAIAAQPNLDPEPNTRSGALNGLRVGVHLPALDGVRGLAIALVVLFHVTTIAGVPPTTLADRVVFGIAKVGWSGVDLFFVLSGFLITGILYDTKGSVHFFRTFYVRRILRIFPLYYAALFGLLILVPWLARGAVHLHAPNAYWWSWAYLSNVWFASQGWSVAPRAIHHFWSLAIEEQFYLVWPLVVFLLSRRRLIQVCCGLLIGALALRIVLHRMGYPLAAYMWTPARADALAIGGLIALIARSPLHLPRLAAWMRRVGVVAAASLVTIAIWRGGLDNSDGIVQTFGLSAFAGLYAALLTSAVTAGAGSWTGAVVNWRPLRALGRYSYAVYVVHGPVIILMRHVNLTAAQFRPVFGSGLLGWGFAVVIASVASTALALLSWHLLEKRFLALKGRFEYATAHRVVVDPALAASPKTVHLPASFVLDAATDDRSVKAN